VSLSDERLYIDALSRDGIISPGKPIFSHRHFFVRSGGKLRLIFDGRRLNARCSPPPVFPMLSHVDLAAICSRFSWAAKFDLANFYFNLRINPALANLFGLRTSMGDFVWNRMPFGFSHSAFHAHELADAICAHLRSLGINVWHYMDDFIVFGESQEQCERDLARCIAFCESICVRVKARKTIHACQQLPILGVSYDLLRKTSSMARDYFARLQSSLSFLAQRRTVSRTHFASFLGAALFVNAAYPGSLSCFNELILWFNCFSALPWSAVIDVVPAIPLARSAVTVVSGFPPCALQAVGRDDARVFADATPLQLGVVVDGYAHAKPVPELPIFEAEAAALAFALDLSGHQRQVLVTDNRGLFFAVRKGRCSNSAANSVISDILRRRLAGAVVGIEWVCSEDNPADLPSRVDFVTDDISTVIFH